MTCLTDTHCHLNFTNFKSDLPEVLERAWNAGIKQICVPAIDLIDSKEIIQLCDRFEGLYAAVGVHPNDAQTWEKDTINQLRDLTQHPKVVAIGEIGLDYYREYAPKPLQKDIFIQQLALAAEVQLPVILHNREAFSDTWEVLSQWQTELEKSGSKIAPLPGVFHSFSEDVEKMNIVISKNFFIGMSGPVTYKNAFNHQLVAAAVPIDHLLIETDAPFLTPHPYRGQRNEPVNVKTIAEKIAKIRQEEIDNLSLHTSLNADHLFAWRT